MEQINLTNKRNIVCTSETSVLVFDNVEARRHHGRGNSSKRRQHSKGIRGSGVSIPFCRSVCPVPILMPTKPDDR